MNICMSSDVKIPDRDASREYKLMSKLLYSSHKTDYINRVT